MLCDAAALTDAAAVAGLVALGTVAGEALVCGPAAVRAAQRPALSPRDCNICIVSRYNTTKDYKCHLSAVRTVVADVPLVAAVDAIAPPIAEGGDGHAREAAAQWRYTTRLVAAAPELLLACDTTRYP